MNTVVLILIEVLVVIGGSRLVGWAFRAINQPLVIGEIVAGIALGPSLLGWLAPDIAGALFPVSAIPFLNVLSQIGLIFFMFLIGLELDPKYLRGNLKTAVVTSGVSILVPFSLAGILSLVIYPLVSNDSVSFTAFALFIGAAMSITAFPVLARIITENNLQNTRLGTLALTCAAVDDVTAWCLLAVAIAVTRTNSMAGAVPIIIYSMLYIGAMLTVGRWMLNLLSTYYDRTGKLSQLLLAVIYMAVVSSALITEAIGIHLIFGAFLLGAAMPKNPGLVREIAQKTEDFVLIFLLPVFFAYSGLKTQIGLLNSPELWLLSAAILGVAIVGKYFGTYYAARSCNIDKQEASALGWLMNTRGLTELIVLNIGLELGVISPILFTMLVIMALVTTFMTSPLLEWTYPKKSIRLHSQPEPSELFDDEVPSAQLYSESKPIPTPIGYRILVPVANPNTQTGLLQLATSIAQNDSQSSMVNPLSLIELEEDYLFQSTPFEANRLIDRRLEKLNALIETIEPTGVATETSGEATIFQPIVQIGYDVAQKTAVIAALDRADLVLLGWHRPTFRNNRLGGKVAKMLGTTPADVAVFIDANHDSIAHSYRTLLVPYTANHHDDLAVEIALRMLWNDRHRQLELIQISLPNLNGALSTELTSLIENLPAQISARIKLSTLDAVDPIVKIEEISRRVDLTITGIGRTWGRRKPLLDNFTNKLAIHCVSSLLIVRRYSQFGSHLSFTLDKVIGDT
ncbi:MAG: cation:proton antiporter [Chamaesiphon sp.]|nr:cation:proton antiporter [Chamaesiphon sp.]